MKPFFLKKKLAKLFCGAIISALFLNLLSCLVAADIREGTLYSWEYIGNQHFSKGYLNEVTGLEKGSLINNDKVESSIRAIKEKYRKKGYFFVDVVANGETHREDELAIAYTIDEGARVKIRETKISGNNLLSAKQILKVIRSRPKGIFGNEYLTEEMLEEDLVRIQSLYTDKGYDSERPQVMKRFSADGSEVNLTFMVYEVKPEETHEWQEDEEELESEYQDFKSEPEEVKATEPTEKVDQVVDAYEGKLEAKDEQIKRLMVSLKEKEEVESLLSGFLAEEKAKKIELINKTESLESRIESLRDELNKERGSRTELERLLDENKEAMRKMADAQKMAERRADRVSNLVIGRLGEIEKIKNQLDHILSSTRKAISKELDRIELAPVSIRPKQETETVKKVEVRSEKPVQKSDKKGKKQSGLRGQVLVVNPDLNFVVINIGATQRAYKSMAFQVMNPKGKVVAEVKIIEVRKNIAAADITSKESPIKVGFEVIEKQTI